MNNAHNPEKSITARILVVEDNMISRELIAGILRTYGYEVLLASDGTDALKTIQTEPDIAIAVVDLNMTPMGGFEFIRHLITHNINIPAIVVTADESLDNLSIANTLNVSCVMHKPLDPQKLLTAVKNTLRRYGITSQPLVSQIHDTRFMPQQLMQRAIALAEKNVRRGKGGPFGAIVADQNGKVLGEGANGISSRVDPVAHAEIMAIRQAAERLGRANLEDCTLYCSSEPTMMGKALIISVGIKNVYYGLSHAEINAIRSKREDLVQSELKSAQPVSTKYIQMGQDLARNVIEQWRATENSIPD